MKKVEKIIKSLSTDFLATERETSILYDHCDNVAHLETSHTYTARRWYELFKNDENVIFDERADTLKMTVPAEYCRKPELVIMAKYRRKRNDR